MTRKHRRHKHKSRARKHTAEEVLEGRASATIEELFLLIGEVNPTGEELSTEEQERAYRLKSRLQSLLIERFGQDLEVEAAPDETIVGLRHAHNRRDACHARLARLSPEAGSWVRARLDEAALGRAVSPGGTDRASRGHPATTGPEPLHRRNDKSVPAVADSPPSPSSPPSRPLPRSSNDLLALGRAALEEYDFEQARGLFEQAFARAGEEFQEGAVLEAVRALLELLVDQLAENGQALALRDRLTPEIVQDREVRGLLGLAAARHGEIGLAERLMAGLEGVRSEEILLALARKALERGACDECERLLGRIPPASTCNATVQNLNRELKARRREIVRPLEEELAAARAAGDESAAERLARELIAVLPENDLARKTLRQASRAKEQAALAALSKSIEEALDQHDAGRAAARLRKAQASGLQRPDLEGRVQEAVQAAAERRARQAVESLVDRLQGELTAATIEWLWNATDSVRSAACHRVDRKELAWILEFGPVVGRSRCTAVAATVEALAMAEDALASGDLERARTVMAGHETMARTIAPGRRVAQRIEEGLGHERRCTALRSLEEAERIADRDPGAARRLLDPIRRSDRPPETDERFEAVARRIRRKEEVRTLAARYDARQRKGSSIPSSSSGKTPRQRRCERTRFSIRTTKRASSSSLGSGNA